MAKFKILRTAQEVIEALGGPVEVCKLTRRSDSGVVWNWYERGIPVDVYPIITEALEGEGKKAAPEVWGNRKLVTNVLEPARREREYAR